MNEDSLRAEIEELRRKIDLLEARLLIAEQQKYAAVPMPIYPAYPYWWQYHRPGEVWCTSTSATRSTGTVTINSAAN